MVRRWCFRVLTPIARWHTSRSRTYSTISKMPTAILPEALGRRPKKNGTSSWTEDFPLSSKSGAESTSRKRLAGSVRHQRKASSRRPYPIGPRQLLPALAAVARNQASTPPAPVRPSPRSLTLIHFLKYARRSHRFHHHLSALLVGRMFASTSVLYIPLRLRCQLTVLMRGTGRRDEYPRPIQRCLLSAMVCVKRLSRMDVRGLHLIFSRPSLRTPILSIRRILLLYMATKAHSRDNGQMKAYGLLQFCLLSQWS